MGPGTFTLTPADDELGEGDEGITIGGTSALPVAGASLVLTDDDAVSTGVTLSVWRRRALRRTPVRRRWW